MKLNDALSTTEPPEYIWWPYYTRLLRAVSLQKRTRLENVAIANALQLEAAWRRAGPIPCNASPVASLKSLSLSVAMLERIYCWYGPLRCDLELWLRDLDLWPSTFILYRLWLDETLCEIRVKSDTPRRSYCSLNFHLMTLNTYHVLYYAMW